MIFTPVGSKLCNAESTAGFRTKLPERPDTSEGVVVALDKEVPGVNVDNPVAVVASSLSEVGSMINVFGLCLCIISWYRAGGRFGFW